MEKIPTRLIVAAALVDPEGRVLLQRRPLHKPLGGLWEFPGGKVEAGEAPEAALVRELAEELGISADASRFTPAGFASAPVATEHMILLLYVLREWAGDPRALHATAIHWCFPNEMSALAMPPADEPLIGMLEALI